jgi:drug/metabolite transporter (DMT)-like permease
MGTDRPRVSRVKLVLAFACIYVLWGSTYLAIKVAVQTLPPFLMAGARFLLAGAFLYALGVRPNSPPPTGRQWRNALIAGVPLFVLGNGGVVYAEQTFPSGLAALVVATLPAWLLLFDWAIGGRRGPGLVQVVGVGLGLGGVVLLATPTEGGSLIGVAVLTGASVAWAAGSLFSRYADTPKSAARTSGMQMLAGGTVMVLIGLAAGESNRFSLAAVSVESAVSFAYLVAVAVVALPAYTWLLTVSSPALVGTYAFVNPVVAVVLGSAVAGEALTGRTGLAVVLVMGGVTLLTWPRRPAHVVQGSPTPEDVG